MYGTQCVLALLALCVGLAHSWDIAVSAGGQLVFYTNGTQTDMVNLSSKKLAALAYDDVNDVMLYVDKQTDHDAICGYYIYYKNTRCFLRRYGGDIHGIAFDPATDTLFFTETNERSIYWTSLKHGSDNNNNGNLLIKMDDRIPLDIAVDSCKGYIYWTSKSLSEDVKAHIEKARFNGSEREKVYFYSTFELFSLAVDPQTRRMYYFDGRADNRIKEEYSNSADLNGQDSKILFDFGDHLSVSKVMTISKDYVYWMNSTDSYKTVWQLPKDKQDAATPKEICKFYNDMTFGLAANYKTKEKVDGIEDCDALTNLIPMITDKPGNTDQRCDVPVCENYCLQGSCSVNDEGVPSCRCNAGYSGQRCEVYECHGYCWNHGDCSLNDTGKPVCECRGDYVGDRCEVSDCLNYCIQGNCSINAEGLPTCRCEAGYSGARCEVNACLGYCLNSGNCSLTEEETPVCACVGKYEGSRCEAVKNINVSLTNTPAYYSAERNISLTDLLSNWQKPKAKISITVEV